MQKGLLNSCDLEEVVNQFKIKGEVREIRPYGSGHINDTYHVANTNPELPDYLLQCINSYVFKDVPLLIRNIEIVTRHIKTRLKTISGSLPDRQVLTLIETHSQKPYHKDATGKYWRLYIFLEDTLSYDIVTTVNQAEEGGKAFGRFQSLISDLNAGLIGQTIPNFHNIEMRLSKFEDALSVNSKQRVKDVIAEIEFVRVRRKTMSQILELGHSGKLPLRITHNDTKFNNVLLDKNDKAQCVIDLDTVMPGYIAYDFGDAIRTIVNTAAEDEADISKIKVNVALFKAFTKGFLSETASFLSDEEIYSLPMGALLLPYIVGLRFLTDYLEGDKYFKIHFPTHNLQRAQAQFQLLKKLEDVYPKLQEIVQTTAQEYSSTVLINNVNN
ncbi:MAG: aminoglycoside phosphotransferase family protein [Sphingobacteriaceae bacterium]|nr:MAG: aminoglycoside phosphotransferase family protein [Sphingobacteriaceae bacterium]